MNASADAQLKAVLDDAVLTSDLGSKTWGGQTYSDVFTGETLVNVLFKDPAKYPSRETAVQHAQELLDTLAITCVTKRRTFDDGERLYCINRKKTENDDSTTTTAKTTKRSPNAKVATEGKEAALKPTNHENVNAASDKTTSFVSESRLSCESSASKTSSNLFRLLEKDAAESVRTGQGSGVSVNVELKDKQSKARKDEMLAAKKMNSGLSKPSCDEKTRGLITSEKGALGLPGVKPTRRTTDESLTISLSDSNTGDVHRSCLLEKETLNIGKHLDCRDTGDASGGKQKLGKTLSPALTALLEKDAKGRTASKEGEIQELGKVKQVDEEPKTAVDDRAKSDNELSRSWDTFEVKLQKKVKNQGRTPGGAVRSNALSVTKNEENGRIAFGRSNTGTDEEEKDGLERPPSSSSLEKYEFVVKEEPGKFMAVTCNDELLMVSVKERKNSFLGLEESGKEKEDGAERKSTLGKVGTGSPERVPSFSLREDAKAVIIEEGVQAEEYPRSNNEISKRDSGDRRRVPSFDLRGDSKTVIVDGALQDSSNDKTSGLSSAQDLVRAGGHAIPKTLAALLAKDGSSAREWEQGSDETNVFRNKLKELKKTSPGISPGTKARTSTESPGGESTSDKVDGKRDNVLDKTDHSKNNDIDETSVNDTVGKVPLPVFKTTSVENNVASTVKATKKSKGTEVEPSKTERHLSENTKKVQELSPGIKTNHNSTVGYVIPHQNLTPNGGAAIRTRPNSFAISPTLILSSPLSPDSAPGLQSEKELQKSREDFEESKLTYESRITELQLQIDFLRRQKNGQLNDENCLNSSASMSELTSLYSSFSTPVASPDHSNMTSPALTPCDTPRGSIADDSVPFSPVSPPPPPPPAPPSVPSGPIVNGGGVKPTKLAVKPRADMKPLFWNRIITSGDSSRKGKCVWKTIKEPVIDTTEFERLFSKKIDSRKVKRTKSLRDDKHFAHIRGKKIAKLLETNRARAIGIKMSSLHCELDDIRNAVYNMDTSAVDMESLQFIYDIYPTEEEIGLIQDHVKKLPAVPLDKPEEFMHQLAKMKHFKERLECWLFQETFSEVICGIDRSLACVTESCSIISANPEISAILSLILAYGNYMNGNTVRGQADGFHLDVLLKLRDVKNKESDMNLLQYIVKQYLKQHERSTEKGKSEIRLPSSVSLFNAAQVSFHKLREELIKVSSLLQETEVQTKKILDECSPSKRNPFEDKMRHFQKMATENISEENGKMEKAVETFQETMEYFQWQPNGQTETPQEFFALWAKFIEDVKNCVKLEKQQHHQAKKNISKVEHLDQIQAAATKFKKRRESVDFL